MEDWHETLGYRVLDFRTLNVTFRYGKCEKVAETRLVILLPNKMLCPLQP